MTEAIEDFLTELKSRLTSPLFGSYVISWCIINWYVPVALIFYSQKDLQLDHYSSYRDLIVHYTSTCYNLLPGVFALAYTFGYPYVKAWINEYQIRVTTASENRITDITSLLRTHQTQINDLQAQIANKEQAFQISEHENLSKREENERLVNEVNRVTAAWEQLTQEKLEALKNNDRQKSFSSGRPLQGWWRVKYQTRNSIALREEKWLIKGNEVIHEDSVKYQIAEVVGDYSSGTLWISLLEVGTLRSVPIPIVYFLKSKGDKTYEGTNSENQVIKLERLQRLEDESE